MLAILTQRSLSDCVRPRLDLRRATTLFLFHFFSAQPFCHRGPAASGKADCFVRKRMAPKAKAKSKAKAKAAAAKAKSRSGARAAPAHLGIAEPPPPPPPAAGSAVGNGWIGMACTPTHVCLASGNSNAVSRVDLSAGALADALDSGPVLFSAPECRLVPTPFLAGAFPPGVVGPPGKGLGKGLPFLSGRYGMCLDAQVPSAAGGGRFALEAELSDQGITWLVQ